MNSSLFPDFPKCQITRNIEIYVSRLQFKGHYRNNRSLLPEMVFFYVLCTTLGNSFNFLVNNTLTKHGLRKIH